MAVPQMTDLEKLAIEIIHEVDYDIAKESEMELLETGSDVIVNGIVFILEAFKSEIINRERERVIAIQEKMKD